MANIAVIDDEELMRDLVATSMTRLGHEVFTAKNGDIFLRDFIPGRYDLIITDLKMDGLTGIELAEKLLNLEPGLSIILMTAYGTIENAVVAMKMGVEDFVEKPFQVEHLEHKVSKCLEVKGLKKENRKLKENLEKRYKFIGESSIIKELLLTVNEIASSNSTILITGESGTGKELIAHSIHSKSLRLDAPFIKINCAAIPENLIESELFGHEKGAYTGAVRTRTGKFELANRGTLLLDEIGEMPIHAQSKLLRVLQERELTKVGGDDSVSIDVRVICTTNRNLENEVRDGNFREDLYYRLNVIPVKVPSLRERKDDIGILCNHFIGKYNRENGYRVPGICQEALNKLNQHNWPGNVRELENIIQRAVVFAKFETIQDKDLRLFTSRETSGDGELYPGMTIAEGERQLILKTLNLCNNNRTKAAELLDISVRTLRNKLNEYKVED